MEKQLNTYHAYNVIIGLPIDTYHHILGIAAQISLVPAGARASIITIYL